MAGVLYVVATPIGNLEDITLRALRVLKEADLIAAEDTRHTRKLLTRYGISSTSLTSYYDEIEQEKSALLIEQLKAGKSVALVSDAGTPTLSDPGFRLVQAAVREAIPIVPIPGPSALTAALSVSGLPTDRFAFEGFLPARQHERRARLQQLREETRTLVFYETPHRLKESLKDLLEVLGDRELVLGREVTKIHEEFIRGRISEVSAAAGRSEPRGEITMVIGGYGGEESPTEELLRVEVEKLKKKGLRVKEIAEVLGEKFSYSKKEIYRMALEK
jgi:16S rRNA (cytidine1402-2'-O)-methyltransferase